MRTIKYFSTFSGIGGFELGIEQAAEELGLQVECIGFSEIDMSGYDYNHHIAQTITTS